LVILKTGYNSVLEFFRKNLFINSLLLLPFCLLIRIKGVIKPIPYNFVSERESSIFNNLMELVSSNWVQGLLASLIVYMQALIINRLCIKHRIAKEMTLIPGLVYITISAVIPDLLSLSPMLIGSTFIIIAVHLLFNTYNSVAAASDIFSAGFLIGLARLKKCPGVACPKSHYFQKNRGFQSVARKGG
jgi:hypothetical protein